MLGQGVPGVHVPYPKTALPLHVLEGDQAHSPGIEAAAVGPIPARGQEGGSIEQRRSGFERVPHLDP